MCGIAGFIDSATPASDRYAAVLRMCNAMVHRGPDDDGLEAEAEATLGMRRLAIFDPANGHQPMQTPDGRFTIVFNGAIYNFRELRTELVAAGWSFRTECDTEVLLNAYAQWGESCLERLRGMFAFAVWDAREKSLHMARDPFGIKPLYYRQDGRRLVFASEINALLASRTFSPEIDPLAVADYLSWLSVPAPRTTYRDIFSLRPGECATWRRGQLDIRSAWNFRTIPVDAKPCASHEEFICGLRARLDDSIRAHMLADVPVGAFLSGGLDSAVITGLMAHAGAAKLRTFSIGFEERGYSEAEEAESTARFFGTEHHAQVLTGREVASDIERLMAAYDQPTGDGVNTYYVSKAARAGGVTVALSGLGGDELFGGYPSFRNLPRFSHWLRGWRALPAWLRNVMIGQLRGGDTRQQKLADLLNDARDIHELASMQRRVFSESRRQSLLGQDAMAAGGKRTSFHPELAALRTDLTSASPFEIASAWELRTYMADVLLRDSDVMSMRHSLELRVPFIDRPLIEWLWRQPKNYKYTPSHPKGALVEAAADILPPALRSRRKHGFTLPFAIWMKGDLKPFLDETFSDASVGRSGLFQRPEVQALWRGYLEHKDTREWSRLWSLAVLIAFTNRRTAAALPITGPVAIESTPEREPASAPAPVESQGRRFDRGTLLMAPELFSSVGGIPRILQLYLKALCDLGKEKDEGVRLIALNDPVLDTSDLRRYSNAHLDNWYVCGRNKRRFVRATLRMARKCDRLICGHLAQLPVAWAAWLFNPRLRYYLVAHGIEVWRPFSLLEKIALRGAHRVLCVSDYTRRELLTHCKLRKDRVVVLHNALDPLFQIENGTPLDRLPPVILTVSRLDYTDRYKGIEDLINAMPAVLEAEPAAQLRIVGRGDDTGRLLGIARRQGVLRAGVDFLGSLDDKHLIEELRNCRLFVLPSKKEGFGLVFLEAMAYGRPCVGARAGGIPEVLTEDSGILVPFGDVPALAAACVDALRRPWSESAIMDQARRFSYPVFREKLAELLK